MDFGYQKELGWFADFWFANRPDYMGELELYKNEFSPTSKPNSNANLGRANSHITIKNFSDNLHEVMSFDFSRDFYEPGFPVSLALQEDSSLAVVGGMVDGRGAFYFSASGHGDVFAVGKNGAGLFSNKKKIAGFSATASELSLALGDASGDGENDFLALATEDSLYAFSLTQPESDSLSALLFPPQKLGARRQTPLVIADNHIYVGCANDTLYTIDFTGQTAAEQLIRENTLDFVVDPSGQPMVPEKFSNFAAAAPLRGQQVELISLAAGWDPAGVPGAEDNSQRAEGNHFTGSPFATGQFAVADVDGNGAYDIIYNTAKALYALNRDGILLSNFPLQPALSAEEYFIGSPLVLDADNDGKMDLIAATNLGRILALDMQGRMLEDFPLTCGGRISHSPMIMQLDEDSPLELLLMSDKGTLNVWQLQAEESAAGNAWLQENLNSSNNAYIASALVYKPLTQKLMPARLVYNYPNPNSGASTKIRYYLNETAEVSIRIYDAAGMQVDSFSGPGQGGTANEVSWNVSDVASGIYLCHVKARSEKQTSEKIIKIMVIH